MTWAECGAARDLCPRRNTRITIGRMGFSIFTDSDFSLECWPLSEDAFHVLEKAASPEWRERYASIAEFKAEWLKALNNEHNAKVSIR